MGSYPKILRTRWPKIAEEYAAGMAGPKLAKKYGAGSTRMWRDSNRRHLIPQTNSRSGSRLGSRSESIPDL
jgi:hypothetical protein